MDLSLQIDTLESIDEKTFATKYLHPQKPFIIKGLVKQTSANGKWNLQYIKDKLGKVEVDVYDNKVKTNTAYTHGDLKMPFSDFVDIISKDEPTSYRLFLFDGFQHAPDLRNEFPCPNFFNGVLGKIGFMFFGGKSTKVRMHFDTDMSNVLLTQFEGKKRVVLFEPKYNDLLYRTPLNTFSIADIDNPDYEKFPGLKYVKGYDVMLEHGDSLFMPSGYWHYITYQEGGFGVSYRKIARSISLKYQGIANLTYRLWIDKFMTATFNSRWINYKTKIAYERANKAIKVIEERQVLNVIQNNTSVVNSINEAA